MSIQAGDKVVIRANWGPSPASKRLAYVDAVLGENAFILDADTDADGGLDLRTNGIYQFAFFASDGLYSASGVVTAPRRGDGAHLFRIKIEKPEYQQRRSFYRVEVMMPVQFSLLKDGDKAGAGDEPTYEGLVKDLSGSGMSFESAMCIEKGASILCHLSFSSATMAIKAEVILSEKIDGAEGAYLIRTMFVDISPMQQNIIVRRVLLIESNLIKKMHAKES